MAGSASMGQDKDRGLSVLIGDPTKISLCWLLEIVRVVPATKLIVFIQFCSGKMAR